MITLVLYLLAAFMTVVALTLGILHGHMEDALRSINENKNWFVFIFQICIGLLIVATRPITLGVRYVFRRFRR